MKSSKDGELNADPLSDTMVIQNKQRWFVNIGLLLLKMLMVLEISQPIWCESPQQ